MTFNSTGHNNGQEAVQEVVILGGGLMGSSAAWHLSTQGKSVLLIEKQGVIYDSGSSKGEARVVRSSNIENDELWSYLHNCSVKEVETLILFLNNQGISITMEDIFTTSPISYISKLEELHRLLKNLKKQDVNFEIASTEEEGKYKFGVNLQKGTFLQREYNTYSGTLNPRKLIQSLHKAITLKGNQIWYDTKIKRITREEGGYSLSTVDSNHKPKTIHANQVVCAAGPYTGPLLKDIAPYFNKLINPKRVFLAFLKIKNKYYQKLTEKQKLQLKNGFPIIDRSTGEQAEEFFAMIESHDAKGIPVIKLGGHYQRTEITRPEVVWRAKLSKNEINWAMEKMVNYLSFLNLSIKVHQLEIADAYSCIYSLTETEVPYVTHILNDKNSKEENFVVIAGMSGVGAKGAMMYGRIAVNLLTDKKGKDAYYETAVAKLGAKRLATKTL